MKRFFLLCASILLLSQATPALAYDWEAAYKAAKNTSEFYDPVDICGASPSSSSLSGANTGPVAAVDGLSAEAVKRINDLVPTYTQAATQTGVPWQVIASLDYRENNNDPLRSMLGGEPLGQRAVDSNNTPQTKLESILMGITILKGKQPIYGVDPTQPMNALQLKQAFITYNRGSSYKDNGLAPDDSPYVMNNFDEAHKDMSWPANPAEPHSLWGHREIGRLGAFTLITRLPGGGAVGTSYTSCAPAEVAPGEMCKTGGGVELDPLACAAYWAQKMLDNPNIVLMNPQYTRGDLEAAVAQLPIHNSDTCGHDTYLHPWLLYALNQTATAGNFKIGIYNIVSGHGCDQFLHPHGRATDIGAINDVTTDTGRSGANNRAFSEYIANLLPHGGEILQANKCYPATLPPWIVDKYDTCNHIHVSVGSQTP